jgi:hypothetical protein
MGDPATIGKVAAEVFALAAEVVRKQAPVADAFSALKVSLPWWAEDDVLALEMEPDAPDRRKVLAEAIDAEPKLKKVVAIAVRPQCPQFLL